LPVPGQQFGEALLQNFCDAGADVGEPCLRVDSVELGGDDQ